MVSPILSIALKFKFFPRPMVIAGGIGQMKTDCALKPAHLEKSSGFVVIVSHFSGGRVVIYGILRRLRVKPIICAPSRCGFLQRMVCGVLLIGCVANLESMELLLGVSEAQISDSFSLHFVYCF